MKEGRVSKADSREPLSCDASSSGTCLDKHAVALQGDGVHTMTVVVPHAQKSMLLNCIRTYLAAGTMRCASRCCTCALQSPVLRVQPQFVHPLQPWQAHGADCRTRARRPLQTQPAYSMTNQLLSVVKLSNARRFTHASNP